MDAWLDVSLPAGTPLSLPPEGLAALDAAGFHTLDAETYARFARGEDVALPSRPVLVTFDDGRLDSFRGADAVLERYGMRATMFAIADAMRD